MENPDLHPMDRKPLNRLTSNLIGVMTSRTSPHMQTLILLPLREVGLHMREIVIISVYFFNTSPPLFTFFYPLAHLHRLHRLANFRRSWLKRRVFASSMSFLWCKQNFFIFSTIFSQFYIRMEHGLDLVDMT